ncbi:MAG TPA: RHS repeat-associated core domain-containing protein [Bryobacteraceae bacterium]|jgi:RHS repeat-associated protein|nr:RHS repeat-associated core domain-containing protein [Bryobacteraceae bacterium]
MRVPLLGVFLAVCVYASNPCDVNQSGASDVNDVQAAIDQALGQTQATADINGDGALNVADIQVVIQAVLTGACTTTSVVSVSSFNPSSGPIGTVVTVNGANFGSAPAVTLSKQGGGSLAQPVATVSAGALAFVVAAGSADGAITVSNGAASGSSASVFTVTAASTFTLSAQPPTATLIAGQSVTYTVSLASQNSFSQLATLAVSGLPSGLTSSFFPTSITANQNSILTVSAPAGQPVSNNTLTISASSTVNGIAVSSSVAVSLSVGGVTTSLLGRTTAADNLETPLKGVTITTLGQDGNGYTTSCPTLTATSDGGGNFAFTNLPMTCTGPQLVNFNGGTVTSPPGKYAGVNLVFTITQNQVTVSPINVHLPQTNTAETFYVQQNASTDQTHSFGTIPGLKVTVYAGTTITMADGTTPNPFPLAAIEVPADRLPDVKPQVTTMMMAQIVAFQPENSTASQPIAVYYPNALNTPPHTDSALITLDPERGTMVPYGTGTVSADGTQVIPDADPAHPPHLYGLVRPGWHFFAPPPPPLPPPPPPPPDLSPVGGDPIYLSSGMEILSHTDLAMNGLPLSLQLTRYLYNTSYLGPFGLGGDHNFDYTLSVPVGNIATAQMLNLLLPNSARQVPFTRQTDGALINPVDPAYAGAVFTTNSDNSSSLRLRDGLTYSFSSQGFLAGIADPNGNSIAVTRNSVGEVASISDSLGRSLTFTYGIQHPPLITQVQDSSGRIASYTYNSSYQLTSFTDVNGGVWQFGWNSSGLASVTDPRGVVVAQNTYDGNGRVISQKQADGSTIQLAYTYYNPTVPANSPILTTTLTDQLGNRTIYRFNSQGYQIQATDPMGQARNFERSPGTNLLLSRSGMGVCGICGDSARGDTSYTYDANGNLLTKSDSLGNTFTYTYDPVFSRVTTITDPNGALTQYQYDNRGNLTGVTDPAGNQTTIGVNVLGLPDSVTDAASQTTHFAYDNSGNLTSFQDPLGETTSIQYDTLFRPSGVTNPSGASVFQSWDLLGRLARRTDGNGGISQWTYDPDGNLLTATDPRGIVTTYTYDSLSRPIKRSDGLGRQEQFAYDSLGNLTRHTDRRGQTAQFSYDSLNRLTVETYPDSSVARSYDANGRLIQVADSASGTFVYRYDSAGRLLNSVTPVGALTYTRDPLGRVATRQVNGLSQLTYQYDLAGNLTQAAMPQATAGFNYDARNLLSAVTRSNGVSTSIGRDALGRILSIAHQAGNNTLASFSYGYDAAGNRSSANSTLAQALTTPAANAVYNSANEMASFANQAYTYDANGNRLTGNGSTYTWDGRNRLASIVQSSGTSIQFTYDYGRNLIGESVTGSGATANTSYLLDQTTNVAAILSAGATPLSLLSGVDPDSHLATISSTGKVEFSMRDAIASIAGTAGSPAALDSNNLYEPFGATTSNGNPFPFAFAGRAAFAGNTLYYNRSRYYDPAAGRFLSEENRLFPGDLNLYRYLNNSPAAGPDPFGASPGSDPFGGLGAWWQKHIGPVGQGSAGGIDLAPRVIL